MLDGPGCLDDPLLRNMWFPHQSRPAVSRPSMIGLLRFYPWCACSGRLERTFTYLSSSDSLSALTATEYLATVPNDVVLVLHSACSRTFILSMEPDWHCQKHEKSASHWYFWSPVSPENPIWIICSKRWRRTYDGCLLETGQTTGQSTGPGTTGRTTLRSSESTTKCLRMSCPASS
ncbi:hypothetical protein BKA80DRAFT_262410 [Phyllosticta citrichinensis]